MPLIKKLVRIGNSWGVILDQTLLRQVDIPVKLDAEVKITIKNNTIVIKAHP